MKTLLVENEDVTRLLSLVGLDVLMSDMIAELEKTFCQWQAGEIKAPPRSGFSYHRPKLGLVEWMPAIRVNGPICVKMVGYHPENPTMGLPTILSNIAMYDTSTGHLMALADGVFLTALRTGAASALASRWLATENPSVLGMIGCGAQSVSQIHALCLEFPTLERVLYFDCDDAAEGSLAERLAPLTLAASFQAAPVEEIVERSDVLCTATSVDVGAGPVFPKLPFKPWLHVNAVGSDFSGKTEIPVSMLRQAFVSPDSEAQAVREGECQQLCSDEIGPEIARVGAEPDKYGGYRDSLTVFDSTGWAVEDLAAMNLLLRYAREYGLGRNVSLECDPIDPLNPYGPALHHCDLKTEAVESVR